MLRNLDKYRIMLGSKSPRRRELLQLLRIPFNVMTIGKIDESYPTSLHALSVPQFLSEKKADIYLTHMRGDELIITADTLVVLGDEIFGKPKDPSDAIRMLMKLSGKTHQVATGVTIATARRRSSFTEVTDVKFTDITEEEARYYVDCFSPLDKAGAYGIQEWIGGIAVEKIDGSFYNVMGLPIHQLYKELREF